MRQTNALYQFCLERVRRICIAAVGLFIYSFGFYLQLRIGIGGSPWHALNQGLSQILDITFGQVSILVSIGVVVFDLLMREPIGIGTLLDAFMVGWGTDFFLWLDIVPYQSGIAPSLVVLLLSLIISCVGARIYMGAGLSCGPRDAMMVAIGKRIPQFSIGTIVILISAFVAVIGWIMGGSVGIGTLFNLLGQGVVMDLVFKVLSFEPRSVEHEGLAQTIRAFSLAARSRDPERTD